MSIDDSPFCEVFCLEVWKNSNLSFSLETSTHKRTPCQRIYFLTLFYFLWFFRKYGQNSDSAYSWKEAKFLKIIDGSVTQSLFFYLKIISENKSEQTITRWRLDAGLPCILLRRSWPAQRCCSILEFLLRHAHREKRSQRGLLSPFLTKTHRTLLPGYKVHPADCSL